MKRIAFYIDSLKSIHSKFYARVLLQLKLRKLGYQLEFHIPRLNDQAEMNSEELHRIPYIHNTRELEKVYGITVHNDLPSPKIYEALLLIENYNAGGVGDARQTLATSFQKAKRRVLCLRDDTIFEYFAVNDQVRHGICTEKLIGLPYKWSIKTKVPRFIMPLLSNPKFPRPNALTREQFYELYHLNPSLKIVAFLPGRCGKWNNLQGKFDQTSNPNVAYNLRVMTWFNQNFDQILRDLRSRGYQMVSKLHIRDPNKFLENRNNERFLHMSQISYVNQLHSYELLNYADLALTIATTMVYYLYLCDLPSLEIGSGVYYPEWSSGKKTKLEFPIPGYQPKELIFGQQVKIETLMDEGIGKVLDSFLKQNHRQNFKYWKNHPIYGQSYGTTPMSVAQRIANQLT